jgi:predicted transcriptional regulator
MYSVSLNQKVGTTVEKEFVIMDEDTIIIDAVKVMRDTVYLLYSLQNQVQERPFYFYMGI